MMGGAGGTVRNLVNTGMCFLIGSAFITSGVMIFGGFYVVAGGTHGRIFAVHRFVSN